jgi:hypothetical protein
MSVFNLLYTCRNSFELSSKFDILGVLCKTCKVLDDEIHFFLQCQINNNLRNVLISNIKKYHANFDQLDFFFKYFYAGIVQSNPCWKIHNKCFSC